MAKKLTITRAKKRLWTAFAAFIRARDKGVCITCGRGGFQGSGYHAGHFIPSAACGVALRYHEQNVWGQCFNCNINLGGWGERYAEVLEKRLGRRELQKLRRLRNKTTKWVIQDYLDKEAEYKEKIKTVDNSTRNIKDI